jgi:predicted dehydrogenase
MGRAVIHHLQQCEWVAGVVAYDICEARVREVRESQHVEATTDLGRILSDAAIRAVFVTASTDAHKRLTIAALEAGKAVMCEKPMATTLADARAMLDKAERLGGFLQIGYEMRYSKLYQKIKEWVDNGSLGQVINTQCTYICSEFHGKASWRNKKSGGSMFGLKLSHYVDFPRWLIGSPVKDVYSVCATNIVPYKEVHDNYQTTSRFENGAVSHLTFMMGPAVSLTNDPLRDRHVQHSNGSGHELRILVVGTRGAAETDVFGRRIKRWEFGDSPERMTSRLVEELTWAEPEDHFYYHNTTAQAHDIVRRVAAGLPPMTPGRDSFETEKLCAAAELSAELGRVVALSELHENDNCLAQWKTQLTAEISG